MPRRNNRVSDADRKRIIDTYERNEDFLVTATSLGVKRSTAYSVIRTYKRSGSNVAAPHGGGRRVKVDAESLDFLIMLIEANPCITLKEMNSQLREVFTTKPHISLATLARALDGQLITLKKVENVPGERNSERVKEMRATFGHWMYQEGLHGHRIYIDETGFNLYTKRTYGRGRQGERVNRVVGGAKGNNVTVIVAISNQVGVLYYEIHDKSVTQATFMNFMTSLEVILEGEQVILIMDNASVHNGLAEGFPDLQFKYLPPYSPFLNPIENCFGVFKCSLKQRLNEEVGRNVAADAARAGLSITAHRVQVLRRAVHDTLLPSVTREVVDNSYTHASTFLQRSIERRDIFE